MSSPQRARSTVTFVRTEAPASARPEAPPQSFAVPPPTELAALPLPDPAPVPVPESASQVVWPGSDPTPAEPAAPTSPEPVEPVEPVGPVEAFEPVSAEDPPAPLQPDAPAPEDPDPVETTYVDTAESPPAAPEPAGRASEPEGAPPASTETLQTPSAESFQWAEADYEDPRELLRASTRRAVERLIPPGPEPTSHGAASAKEASPGSGSQRPTIGELTAQVERAVQSAAAAEAYQREVEQKAREAAVEILADAAAEAQRTLTDAVAERNWLLDGAQAEAEKIVSDARAEAGRLLSEGEAGRAAMIAQAETARAAIMAQAESDAKVAEAGREAILARAESQAKVILAQAEVELGRRVRRIAALTDEITDMAEAAADRLTSGSVSRLQIAQFITALGTVTERALDHIEQSDRAVSAGGHSDTVASAQVTDDPNVSEDSETAEP